LVGVGWKHERLDLAGIWEGWTLTRICKIWDKPNIQYMCEAQELKGPSIAFCGRLPTVRWHVTCEHGLMSAFFKKGLVFTDIELLQPSPWLGTPERK
jgi:hypothetical protein